MDSVLNNCVRSDRLRDSGTADVPSNYGHAYAHAASSKVTRPRRLPEKGIISSNFSLKVIYFK